MKEDNFKVYGYRWVMLVVFMFIVAINQLLWITFASITSDAVKFYGVSDLSIGLLSMIFMIVYIVVSIPASWVIDTYGLRVAVGIGAALTTAMPLIPTASIGLPTASATSSAAMLKAVMPARRPVIVRRNRISLVGVCSDRA